ncbi:uncharacterized protein [Montipora foliosa]|uniref:uncharacterized protein n=1 Tax=Montipora foliosa TaxID=591990 RepID=UPI0035F20C94
MGSFDGAEICELVGLFILSKLKDTFGNNIGLYREDGLVLLDTKSGRLSDKARKDLTHAFNELGLNITAQANQLSTNFLDITFDLSNDETKIEEDVSNSCDFASAIQACIVDLETAIAAEENTGKGQDIQGTTLGSQNSNSSIQAGTQSKASIILTHAKLPKLELRKFSGDPINWHPFWESFESAIHKNTTLSDVERFQYLKSFLEGSAAQTISGLALTSSNYDHAVQLLDKRFGNKQVIISKHIELLMQLPKVSDGSDLKQLRQLLDRTKAAVRSLKGIGISTETYGTFLTPVIMGKIPHELRLILSRGTSEDWDLDTIIKSFTEELQIRERCALGTSYISSRLTSKLSLRPIGSDTVLIQTFGNNEPSLKQCSIVQFALECQDNLTVFINAYEVELICGPITNQTIEIAQQCYPHLQGLPLADHSRGDEDLEIDVMIGADHYWSVVQNHVVRGELHGPVAIRTRLGYVLSGPVNAASANTQLSTVNVSHVMKTECQVIEENFVSDDFLLKEELKSPCFFIAKIKVQQYDSVIKEQLNAGVVELIDKSHDLDTLPGTVHYIPHKEVLKEDRITTKLRVVYDASAKSRNEPSLNDCLLPGPALTPLIFDVLLRFRLHKVVLIGELEKEFLNIEVNPAERNLLTFLWVDDINSPNPEVITLRFTRLVFGLVCSPFILNVTLRNHLTRSENIDPEFVAAVVRALYVDDFASGENTVTKFLELYHKLKLRFREGGFNMRKWASNSEELTEMIKRAEESLSWEPELSCKATPTLTEPNIEEEDWTVSNSNNNVSEETVVKVMGVQWHRMEDNFEFDLATFSRQALVGTFTKRTY